MADEGFLGRWSRRKQGVREGRALDEPAPTAESAGAEPLSTQPVIERDMAPNAPAAMESSQDLAPAEAPRELTLDDVSLLTRESDYSAFVARSVSPQVRNAAMRKLFSDPHFNVMDGLDTYIDDYSKPEPLPASMLAKLSSAQFMKLVDAPPASGVTPDSGNLTLPNQELTAPMAVGPEDDLTHELVAQPNKAAAAGDTAEGEAPGAVDVAPSVLCNDLPTLPGATAPQAPAGANHADTDLRLQRHDAAGRTADRSGPP